MDKGIRKPGASHESERIALSELIHQHVRLAIETAVHEELRAALGARSYERSDVRRGYLLRQVVPRDARLALLIDETNPGTVRIAQRTQAAAGALGVPLQSLGVRDPGELDRAFAAMKEARAGALIVEPSSMLFTWRKRLADLALQHRLPTVFAHRQYVEAGGLMGYATDASDLFRGAATFVDKILKGAKPADLPVEQPTKFELVINLKTAKALGLKIPQSLPQRADQIIE